MKTTSDLLFAISLGLAFALQTLFAEQIAGGGRYDIFALSLLRYGIMITLMTFLYLAFSKQTVVEVATAFSLKVWIYTILMSAAVLWTTIVTFELLTRYYGYEVSPYTVLTPIWVAIISVIILKRDIKWTSILCILGAILSIYLLQQSQAGTTYVAPK